MKELKKYHGQAIWDAGQAVVQFLGTPQAEIFSRLINESLAGTLKENLVRIATAREPAGFVHASPRGQAWHGTFWTRDGGTYLRELAFWGAEGEMRLVANAVMDLVGRNEEGFYAYPEYFKAGATNFGQEIDGTGSILVALALVAERLKEDDPLLGKIRAFFFNPCSPVHFFTQNLVKEGLIAGTGEFGPGCGLKGAVFNVVQNGLVRLGLMAGSRVAAGAGENQIAGDWRALANSLGDTIKSHFTAEDGGWLWCITPDTMKPDVAILNHEINDGFGGILGIFCMQADALGILPDSSWLGIDQARTTFDRLWRFPRRKEMFQKYGIWIQFNRYFGGTHSGPSYGQGYALQTMLLMNNLEMVEAGLNGLVEFTYNQGQRRSPYYIFEQWRVPPVRRMARIGCGELNLVNVTETLKVTRLMIGLDDRDPNNILIVPRLPPSWTGVKAERFPIRTPHGVIRATIDIMHEEQSLKVTVVDKEGKSVPFSVVT